MVRKKKKLTERELRILLHNKFLYTFYVLMNFDDYLLYREHYKFLAVYANPELFQKIEIESKNKLKLKYKIDHCGKETRKKVVGKYLNYLKGQEGVII